MVCVFLHLRPRLAAPCVCGTFISARPTAPGPEIRQQQEKPIKDCPLAPVFKRLPGKRSGKRLPAAEKSGKRSGRGGEGEKTGSADRQKNEINMRKYWKYNWLLLCIPCFESVFLGGREVFSKHRERPF